MFIAIEGGDGAGKTTVQTAIRDYFVRLGHDESGVILTSDLAGTVVGERIRALFLDPDIDADDDTNMLLMTAARMQSLKERIIPALNLGKIVITDRFVDSTYAYQVHAGRGTPQTFRSACEAVLPVNPDLTLILDIDPRVGLIRAGKRGDLDKIEERGFEFADKVREGLLKRAYLPGRVVINADQPAEMVARDCIDAVSKRFRLAKKIKTPSSDAPTYG